MSPYLGEYLRNCYTVRERWLACALGAQKDLPTPGPLRKAIIYGPQGTLTLFINSLIETLQYRCSSLYIDKKCCTIICSYLDWTGQRTNVSTLRLHNRDERNCWCMRACSSSMSERTNKVARDPARWAQNADFTSHGNLFVLLAAGRAIVQRLIRRSAPARHMSWRQT